MWYLTSGNRGEEKMLNDYVSKKSGNEKMLNAE